MIEKAMETCKKFLPKFATNQEWLTRVERKDNVFSARGNYHDFLFEISNPIKRADQISKAHILTLIFAKVQANKKIDAATGFDYRNGWFTSFCAGNNSGYSVSQKMFMEELNAVVFPDQIDNIGKFFRLFTDISIKKEDKLFLFGSNPEGNATLKIKVSKHNFYPSSIFDHGDYSIFIDDEVMRKLPKKSKVSNSVDDLIPALNGEFYGKERYVDLIEKEFDGKTVSDIYRKSGRYGAFISFTINTEPISFIWVDQDKNRHVYLCT